jgi:hypothetical protein
MIFTDTYMIENVRRRLAQANMSNIESSSTLCQPLERVEQKEESRKGLDEDAGCAVIAARKSYG